MIRNVALAMVTVVFTPVEGDGRNMGELEHILGKVLEQAIARDMMFSSAASVPAVQGKECDMRALTIEPGQRFGRLVTIERVAGSEKRRWRVRCDCGNERAVEASPLLAGITQSCGCLAKERRLVANLRHGDASDRTQAPEYHRYKAMIQRCCNPKHPGFKNYGLRGITVCDRWRFGENGESGYQCFLSDMGRRPSPKYLIDRINNDGNFEPGNCRWSTRAERASNQRRGALVTPT